MYITVDTSFNLISYLISEFFHLEVFSVEHASSKGPAVMEEGRSNRLPV